MLSWIKHHWILVATLLFSLLCIYNWYQEQFLFFALPLLFLGAIIVFLKPDFLWFLLAFVTPISINPSDVDLSNLSLSLPSEPILFFLLLLFFYYIISKKDIDTRVFVHPFSSLIYLYLGWMLISCFTSSDVAVSIKFFIAKLWFIIPCFFLSYYFLKEEDNRSRFLLLFIFSLTIVAAYNIVNLAGHNFEDKPSQWTMRPFFKDHTVLGAALAMGIPMAFGAFRLSGTDVFKRLFYPTAIVVMVFCLVITFARAAWLSMLPALLLWIVFLLKIRFRYLLSVMVMLMLYLTLNFESILQNLEQNKAASSDDFAENIESVTNISTDQSNLERINRWASAYAMWEARPLFGWGPGTYMFEYAPFQLLNNRTEISTNFGDIGNAHSEYLGALAEGGWPALVLFFLIMIFVFYYAFRAFYGTKDRNSRIWISSAACGLITYFTHGFLNNFLDTDKAAVFFWFLISSIIYFDLKNQENSKRALPKSDIS